ncbi:tetratricopeptide repeat protein [Geomesophilobacter sediminis]|uniref:Tetratricopeptide repeat protein n=1 Tax=Geomesophilobacter sediminis TaxID=2798584 RepID=A0A8J7M2I5_9BACT|nr:tetratricopeptide repeat protein [Geomesophilobacter sediminis]MBJ6727457.1 tetratricopeptide repeat protein [Geomesophilobacter sediminis]
MVDDSLSFWTDIKRYEDELSANPSSMCFLKLAEVYRRLGLLDDAVSVAQKGSARHPDSVEALLVLGEVAHDRGLVDEARPALERVLAVEPENVTALKLLGRIYAADAEIEKAQQMLERALLQAPDDPEVSFLLASLDAAPPKGSQPVAPEEPVEELSEPIGSFEDLDLVEELVELEEVEVIDALDDLEELEGLFDLEQLEEKGAHLEPAGLHEHVVEPAAAVTEGIEAPREPSPTRKTAASISPAAPRNPLSTVTMAELYVTQGLLEKALDVYRDLLAADPGNPKYLSRSAEIIEIRAREAAVPPATDQGSTQEIVNRLTQWLDNIRSRRHGI